MTSSPRVCIVVLNWNGWQDTIECLESIHRLDLQEICTLVIDNHSTDDSVARITAWAEGNDGFAVIPNAGAANLRTGATTVIRFGENLGFARGCNVGIELAINAAIDYVWLLNNDTVAAPDSLSKLVELMDHYPEYAGATGQIRYHAEPDAVWNCGGTLLPLGLRRYYFRNARTSAVPATGHRKITFMTGCAALLRTQVLSRLGALSEDFFFGEEDFELCQRLQRNGEKLACRYDAVIYHKVGRSISKTGDGGAPGKVYLHHLNRFVHMRRYWNEATWNLWRFAYCAYLLYLLTHAYGVPVRRSIGLIRRLLVESYRLRQVDRFTFQKVLEREQTAA